MAGLILTISVIFIIAGGFLTGRFVVRMNRLENRVNIIVHELCDAPARLKTSRLHTAGFRIHLNPIL